MMGIVFPTGACALGSQCLFPFMELRPQHKCKHCSQIVHVLCSETDHNDMHYCRIECRKQPSSAPPVATYQPSSPVPPPPTSTIPLPTEAPPPPFDVSICHATSIPPPSLNSLSSANKRKRVCSSCKGERVSSKKCKNYKPRSTKSSSSSLPNESVTVSQRDAVTIHINNDHEFDRLAKPTYINIDSNNTYQRVFNVDDSNCKTSSTEFVFMKTNEQGKKRKVIPSVTNLVEQFLCSSAVVESIVINSNSYIDQWKLINPTADTWRRKNDCAPITSGDVYQFIAILYYMGIVRLASKDDYWSTHEWMPSNHPVCVGMSRNRFRFI